MCKFCEHGVSMLSMETEDNSKYINIKIVRGILCVETEEFYFNDTPINFCPYCGRELEEEDEESWLM